MTNFLTSGKFYLFLLCSCMFFKSGAQWVFKENKGQWPDKVAFAADIPGGQVYFEHNTFTFDLFIPEEAHQHVPGEENAHGPHGKVPDKKFAYKLEFLEASAGSISSKSTPFTTNYNYFKGSDKSKWAGGVKGYADVFYHELYPNIDVNIRGKDSELKYDFICKPGFDVASIQMKIDGFENVRISKDKIYYQHKDINLVESIPKSYQVIEGDTVFINCHYKQNSNGSIGIVIENYNVNYPLIIDPSLIFSTYSGSFANNFGFTATYDNLGFLYGGGNAYGSNYPTVTGSYDNTFNGGDFDISISKFSTDGTTLVYSTYIGGNNSEQPHSIVANEFGELYILGTSGSSNFPTTAGVYQENFAGGTPTAGFLGATFSRGLDIVISKLSADGSQLLASTYFGGTDNDGYNGPYISSASNPTTNQNYADEFRGEIDIDASGTIYIASTTYSDDFPITPNAFQVNMSNPNAERLEGIITVFKPDLSDFIYSTYIGGSGHDVVHSIALKNNELIFSGGTTSSDINIPNNKWGFQSTFGGVLDGFYGSFNLSSFDLNYFSYVGSTRREQAYFIEYDKEDFIYIFGQTRETGNYFNSGNPGYIDPSGGLFVSKFSADGKTRLLSSTVGTGAGLPRISPTAFLVDNCQRIYIAGWGSVIHPAYPDLNTSFLPVTADAFDGVSEDDGDQYLAVFGPDMSNLVYGTYLGDANSGEHVDGGTSRFDKKGIVYQAICAGCQNQSGFPTSPGAVSSTNNSGGCNMLVFKFDLEPPLIQADFTIPDAGCQTSNTFTFNNLSTPADEYVWTFPDGSTSTQTNPSYTFTEPGIYDVTLVANKPASCNLSDEITKSFAYVVGGDFEIKDTVICAAAELEIGPGLDPSLPVNSYLWDAHPDIADVTDPNPKVSPLQDADYKVTVDIAGCEVTYNYHVTVEIFTPDLSADTILCTQENPVTLSTNSGNGVIKNFYWSTDADFTTILSSNPASDSLFDVNVFENTKYYVRYNSTNCVYYDSIQVNRVSSELPKDTATCNDGILRLALANNSFVNSYKWARSLNFNPILNDNNQDRDIVVNVSDTTTFYYQMVTGDCILIDSIVVSPFQLSPIPDTVICNGFDLELGFMVPSNPNLTFKWNPHPDIDDIFDANPTVNPNTSTKYRLIVFAGNNCSDTLDLNVEVEDILYSITPDTMICDTETPLLLEVESLFGVDIVWSDDRDFSNKLNTGNNPSIAVLQDPGRYVYYVEMQTRACYQVDSVVVIRHDPIESTQIDACLPGEDVTITSNGFGMIDAFFWSDNRNYSNQINDDNQDSTIIVNPTEATYYYIRTSTPYCTYFDSVLVKPLIVSVTPDTLVCNPANIIPLVGTSNYNNTQYTWSKNINFSNPLNGPSENKIEILPSTDSETYFIRFQHHGCEIIDSVRVVIHKPYETKNLVYCDVRDSLDLISDGEGFITKYEWSLERDYTPTINTNLQDSAIRVNPKENIKYYIRTSTPYCIYEDSVFVEPFIFKVAPDTLVCDLNTPVTFTSEANFPNTTTTWSDEIDFSNVLNPGGETDITVLSGAETKAYFVRFQSRGCDIVDSARILIHQPFDADETIICSQNASVELISNGYGKINSFVWSSSNEFLDTLNSSIFDSTIVVSPPISSWFYIRTESDLCKYEDSVFVKRLIPNLMGDTLVCDPNIPIVIDVDGNGVTSKFTWDTLPDFSSVPPLPTFGNDSTISVLPDTTTKYYILLETSNCNYIDSVTVLRYNTGLELDTMVYCSGGQIDIEATTAASALSYEWSETPDFTTVISTDALLSVQPASGQNYYLKVTTEFCDYIDSVFVQPFVLNPIPDSTICNSSSIDLGYFPAPFSNAQYSWDAHPDISDITEPNPTVTPSLGENTYQLTISIPGLNCPQKVAQKVHVKHLLDSITPSQLHCIPADLFRLNAYSIDTFNTSYIWSDQPDFDNILNHPDSASIFVNPAQTTTYYVALNNGICQETAEVTVEILDPFGFSSVLVCDPKTNIVVTPDGKGLIDEFIWSSTTNFSDTLNQLPDSVLSVMPNVTTTYYVLGKGEFCNVIDSMEVQRYVSGLFNDSLICDPSLPTTLNAIGAGAGVTFDWDTLANFASPTPPFGNNSSINVLPDTTTKYYLRINTPVCSYVDSVTLHVIKNGLPDVPEYICQFGGSYFAHVNSNGFTNQIAWSRNSNFSPIISADSNFAVSPDTLTTYYVRVRTDYCEFVDSIKVSPFELPNINGEAICPGTSVTLGPDDASLYPNSTFTWSANPFIPTASLNNPNPTILPDTTYRYELLYQQGACSHTFTQTIVVDYMPDLITQASPFAICEPNMPVTFTANSGGFAASIIWSDSPSLSPVLNTNPQDHSITYTLPNGQSQATLYVEATSELGCTYPDQITIEQLGNLPNIASTSQFCLNDTVGLSIDLTLLNIQPQDVFWQPIDIITTTPATGDTITTIPKDSVTVTAQLYFNPTCIKTVSKFITPSAVFFYEPEITLVDNSIVLTQNFTLENDNPSPLFTTNWLPAGIDGLITDNQQTYLADESLEYVLLQSTDGFCAKSDTFHLSSRYNELLCGPPNLFVPNAFSPNGDEENDILKVRGSYIDDMLFRVYDRWGQLLFESNDKEIGWDGTFNGKLLSPAVYVYYVRGTCTNNAPFYMQGNVTLLR